mgnify:FL=1
MVERRIGIGVKGEISCTIVVKTAETVVANQGTSVSYVTDGRDCSAGTTVGITVAR